MEITVNRKYKKESYTIGEMRVDGKYFSSTCEDRDRGLNDDMMLSQIKKLKVYGQTAIPTGTYDVTIYYWPKYQKNYPMINDVKGFTGILIHGGRNANDSLGCILVGENKVKGGLINCDKYVRKLTTMCETAIKNGEKVTLTIY